LVGVPPPTNASSPSPFYPRQNSITHEFPFPLWSVFRHRPMQVNPSLFYPGQHSITHEFPFPLWSVFRHRPIQVLILLPKSQIKKERLITNYIYLKCIAKTEINYCEKQHNFFVKPINYYGGLYPCQHSIIHNFYPSLGKKGTSATDLQRQINLKRYEHI
jgi:hypothetical protein